MADNNSIQSQKQTHFITFCDYMEITMRLTEFLDALTAKGEMSFTSKQAQKALGASEIAVRAAIRRLKQKGEITQPTQGFYVIVPPEYRILGCRPAEHFINELMEYLDAPYYVGLLSAAQYYGAAHHRPQQYQVVTNQKRRPITCGRIKIVFITNKDIQSVPIEKFKTSHSIINISTPEATAKDLVIYSNRCGGLDNVLTVLNDLIKKIDVQKLDKITDESEETPWIQRLGYLLDTLNAVKLSSILARKIKSEQTHTRLLEPPRTGKFAKVFLNMNIAENKYNKMRQEFEKNKRWKLIINKKLEIDE